MLITLRYHFPSISSCVFYTIKVNFHIFIRSSLHLMVDSLSSQSQWWWLHYTWRWWLVMWQAEIWPVSWYLIVDVSAGSRPMSQIRSIINNVRRSPVYYDIGSIDCERNWMENWRKSHIGVVHTISFSVCWLVQRQRRCSQSSEKVWRWKK